MHHALSTQYTALRTPTLPTLQAFYILFLLCPIRSHSLDVRHWGLVGFLWRGARLGAWISGNSDGPDLRKPGRPVLSTRGRQVVYCINLYQFHTSWGVDPMIITIHQLSHMDASANMCKPSERMVGDPFVPWKPKASSKTIRISPSVLTELRIAPLVTRTSPEWQQIVELAGADRCGWQSCFGTQEKWPDGHWGLKRRYYMTMPWHAWAGQWCRETVEMQKRRGWVLKLFYRISVDLFYFHILYTYLIL